MIIRVVGCFLEYDGKFVLLLRHKHKPEGNTWALPGGKVEPNETDIQAIIRELEEETGYKAKPSEVEKLDERTFWMTDGEEYTYVTHRVKLDKPHALRLEESAHQAFQWITVEEADKMDNLISGLHDLFRYIGYIK